MDWIVGKPLSKLGGKLKMNPFQAFSGHFPHKALTGDQDCSSRGIAMQMLYYQLVISFHLFDFFFSIGSNHVNECNISEIQIFINKTNIERI
jgi:hypothetical protein